RPLVRQTVVEGVDLASGQIVIAKAETLDVRPSGEPEGLQPIDPQQDLMPGAPAADAARAFEFQDDARDSWKLTVDITRYELVEVKRTSIERAAVRMEVTRSEVISVQALYRVRSARQRLPIVLPGGVKFDTDPLRINGRSMALEQGGQDEYFAPLTGQSPDEPFLLELRFTYPGTRSRLELPQFSSGDVEHSPAVQKVYLCAYIPRELTLLGSRGPWTNDTDYRWYEDRPTPKTSDRQVVNWVIEGMKVTDPFEDFATDGRLYLFSTIQPKPGGLLRLVAMNEKVLHSLVFAIVLLGGLLLIRQPLPQKFAAIALLAALLLLAGVFAPIFARQVMDGALLTAVLIVLVVWAIWYVARWSNSARDAWMRRRAMAALSDQGTSAQPPDSGPHPGTQPPESPFGDSANKPVGDATPPDTPNGSASPEQEGGRQDA
ncbi:MAG: hypothetical protein JJ992_22060, partial [Planctomycetes bacterium]|nr:hypothetical protein [Planctomycetota bacterium]